MMFMIQQFQKLGISIGKERLKEIVSGNFYSLTLFLLDLQKNGRSQVFFFVYEEILENLASQ